MATFGRFLALSFLLTSCGNQMGTPEDELFQTLLPFESVSFSVLQDQLLNPYCVNCHEWAGQEMEVLRRIEPGNPEASSLYTRVADGSMPKDAILNNRSAYLRMIRQFVLGVSKGSFPATIPLEPTYASLKVHLYDKSCMSCHGEIPSADTDLQLNTYARAKRKAKTSLKLMKMLPEDADENNIPMPPPGEGPRVSKEVIETFERWIDPDLGFPE